MMPALPPVICIVLVWRVAVVRVVPTWILEFTRRAELNVARPTTFRVLWVTILWALMKLLPTIETGPLKILKPPTVRLFETLRESPTLTVLAACTAPPTVILPPI